MTAVADAPDAAALLELINASWTTQALGAAAQLGVAEALASGPHDIAALAEATGCDRGSLHRLMRALASLGACEERGDGSFRLTAMGSALRGDASPSLRNWAIWASSCQWPLWGALVDSVRTGRTGRELLGGAAGGYTHLEDNPAMAAVFNAAMIEITRLVADSVVSAFDFTAAHRVVDVGGGHGELLAAILAAHPRARGVIFDLPHAIEGARARMAAAGLQGRCEFTAGSFFDTVPKRADVYVLKSILHNWDDDRACVVLRHCRDAVAPGGRILVVDRIMPRQLSGDRVERAIVRSDLNMLVAVGGRERTLAEFEALFAAGGLRLESAASVAVGFSLLVALPA